MENIISAVKVSKSYNDKVLNSINLNIEDKSFTTIIGPRGSGKTTLINILSGVIKPDSGEITFNDKLISNIKENERINFRRKNCGFIFEESILLENISIIDNLVITGKLTYRNEEQIIKRLDEISKIINIKEYYEKEKNSLSNLSISNIELVRSLINSPKVLFIDEGLSLNEKDEIEFLNNLNKINNVGQTIVMTTTNKKVALNSDRIIYLSNGKIQGEIKLDKYKKDDKKRKEKLDKFLNEMGW